MTAKNQRPVSMHEKFEELNTLDLLKQPTIRKTQANNLPNVYTNCPYYGLYQIRQNQQRGINETSRNDFILRSLTIDKTLKLPNRMRTAIETKNYMT